MEAIPRRSWLLLVVIPTVLLLLVALVWSQPHLSHTRNELVASMEFINRIRNWTDYDPHLEERGVDIPSRSSGASQAGRSEQSKTARREQKAVGLQTSQTLATDKSNPKRRAVAEANTADNPSASEVGLRQAMVRGNPDASVHLANLYLKGDGVPRSCDQAIEVLHSAAAQANVRARNQLAAMYASGGCVQRNRVLAYQWIISALAADPNNRWAQQNRDLTWQQMTPQERSMADLSR